MKKLLRQEKYKKKMLNQGFRQVSIWVPKTMIEKIKSIAEGMRSVYTNGDGK